MNITVIVLGIMVVVLSYFLYKMYTGKSSLVEKVDLKTESPVIPASTLPEPASLRYSYGVWIFVNSWSSLYEKNIFSRYGANNQPDIRLYLAKDSPHLKFDIRTEGGSKDTILITDNFPLQKWVYVITSIDNRIADMYIDGKLVISKKLSDMPAISQADIKLGGTVSMSSTIAEPLDIFLSKFSRWTNPMDPGTAWSKYSSGNGVSSAFPNYGMKLTILKDNVDSKQIRFF
jgi:hypothetical protein